MPKVIDPKLVIALDVGGTEIKAAYFDGIEHDEIIRVKTKREDGSEAIAEKVMTLIAQMQSAEPKAVAVGIALAGQINEETGVAEVSENLGWNQVPFRKMIEDLTGLPVGFGHDVRAGGLAEQLYGSLAGVRDGIFMPIGTGISGAMVIQGSLNNHKLAGEIGHIDVGSGRECACGSSGCLETVSSGPSIAKIYFEKSGVIVPGAAEVYEFSTQGDTHAIQTWQSAVQSIAYALKSYISLLAPSVVVIGGGVSKAGSGLIDPIKFHLQEMLTWQEMPEIVTSKLGDLSTCLGASILANNAYQKAQSK